jgi:hypothetical protein
MDRPTAARRASLAPTDCRVRQPKIDVVADDEDEQEGDYSSDKAAELDHPVRVGRLLGGYT